MRHRIVADIVDAYERADAAGDATGARRPMAVDVFAADEQADHPVDLERWAALARAVLEDRGVAGDAEVSLLFVDEPAIAALNSGSSDQDGPTDVLAFPIDDEPDPQRPVARLGGTGPGSTSRPRTALVLLGDVVICPAVAARNAAEHGVTFDDELALLVVHGLLHLSGMDHEATTRPSAWSAWSGSCWPASTGRRRCSARRGPA